MSKPDTDPCLFAIFGATGDLVRRKLLPTIYHLVHAGQLPEGCRILGVGRDEALTDDRYRGQARAALAKAGIAATQKIRRWCEAAVHYQGLGAGDAEAYAALGARIVAQGDLTLFVHADQAEALWRLYTPLRGKRWPLHAYPAGSAGPSALHRLTRDPGAVPRAPG